MRVWRADRVAAHDLVFSAPSSVTAVWALATDELGLLYGVDLLYLDNDRLFMLAHDNQPDSADCGPGYDKVWVNVEETQDTYQNCEVILKVRVTHAQSEDDDN